MTADRDATLDYVLTGTGPGLVLIHGTGADARSNWGPLIDSVSDRYTVLAPNLPGAGLTPVPAAPVDVHELAAGVVTAARAAGLGPYHLVGHSLGAVLAAVVAARDQASVRSVILHAGWVRSGPREAFMFDLWSRLLRSDPRLLARYLILEAMGPDLLAAMDTPQLAESAEAFEAMLDERILGQLDLDSRVDLSVVLSEVRAPTLVLASAQDQVVPPRHQRELADAIPGARYLEVPGGHGLPFEDPARFFAIITDHLGQQERRAAAALGQTGATA
jgi:pimeloyl-ACP methyl ester carboxylesterase